MPEDTPLHEAVRYDDLEEAEALLRSRRYDPDQVGVFQWNCLHEAAANGLGPMLLLLLRHGADPNRTDALKGFSALHYAAEMDDLEAAEALIEAGARLDVLSKEGLTPLDVATGLTRDLLLRKAPLLLKSEPQRIKENQELLDCISKISSDLEPSTSSRSASAQSINNVGSAELSFEYNSKKDYLKVRVWRLSDLLMPPAHNSPITALFLRGRIDIGKRQPLKSDTELVRAYPDYPSSDSLLTEDGLFERSEAVYRFQEPIHFRDITPTIVAERSLRLTLCVRTKRPAKVFPVSSLEIPLRDAVLRLTKTVNALRPLSEAESRLPAKARLFGNASLLARLRPPLDGRSTYSNPSLRGERLQMPTASHARSASDSDLRGVTCLDAGSDAVSLELGGLEELCEVVQMPLNEVEFLGGKEVDAEDEEEEEEMRETSLVSVMVHRPPENELNVALDVPLIENEEEEDEEALKEVLSGCDNPTFVGSVEYLMPAACDLPKLTSDLRVHRMGRPKRKKKDEMELRTLGQVAMP